MREHTLHMIDTKFLFRGYLILYHLLQRTCKAP